MTTDADPFSLEEVDSKLCMRRAVILQEVVLCVESIALASALVPRMGLMMLHRPEKTNPSCLPMHEIYEARLHGSTAKAKEQAPDPKNAGKVQPAARGKRCSSTRTSLPAALQALKSESNLQAVQEAVQPPQT